MPCWLVCFYDGKPPAFISETADKAQEILSLGSQCGEGWLLTGEMVELIDSGVENIACLQPFACRPNHVTGKGMMKALRKRNPRANIVAVDYDPGASNVNQLNRIKLMMSTAYRNMELKEEEERRAAKEAAAEKRKAEEDAKVAGQIRPAAVSKDSEKADTTA